MEKLLIYREKLLNFLSSHWQVCGPIGKFIGGLFIFYVINSLFGYSNILSQPFSTLILAGICVFLPFSMTFLLCNLIIIIHLSMVSIEIAILYFIILGIYYLLYQRMFPEMRYLFFMTPVFFFFHLTAVIPLFVGTFIGITGIPAIVMGTFLYIFALTVQSGVVQVNNGSFGSQLYNFVFQGTIENKELIIYILCFIFVAALVVGIRRMQVDYGWYFSIFIGGIAYVIIVLVGGFFTGNRVDIGGELIIAAVSIFVVMVMQFFKIVIDYSRQETLEFEDDDYYYYVKAIPKSRVNEEEINITKINPAGKKFGFKKHKGE